MRVNIIETLLCDRAMLPAMRAAGGGVRIINIGSDALPKVAGPMLP
jgi:hypothetical protein